jgi:hypothetical protein
LQDCRKSGKHARLFLSKIKAHDISIENSGGETIRSDLWQDLQKMAKAD